MNTIQLECFLSVAEHLNFSRASEELKITQPAVSHQIRALEDEMGVKLFSRTSKSVTLTEEGIMFLPDEHFISFEVGCHNYLELNLLPPVFRRLTEEYPLLRPGIRLVPFPSLLGLVENKQLHAAFSIKEEQNKSSLFFRELYSAPVACVCSPDYPLAKYEALRKKQLKGNIIVCSPRQITNSIFSLQNSLLVKLPPEQRYFSESIESAYTLAKAGIGYTLGPDIALTRDPALQYIPITDLPKLSFGVYYRYDNDHPVLKRFLALCSETLRK